jgi:hypothetical protein
MSTSKLYIMYIVITSKVFIKNLSGWFKIIWRSYPAAKPVAPERDMVPVAVVIPLGAVQRGCREGRTAGRKTNRNLHREQGVDKASSRAATGHSPKTWLPSSPEQVSPWTETSRRPTLPSRVCAGDGTGRTRTTGFVVCPTQANCREDSLFIGNIRREGKSLRQEMKRLAAGREGTPVMNTNSVACEFQLQPSCELSGKKI